MDNNAQKEELMGKSIKDLIVETLIQAKQTNGQVERNCEDIKVLKIEMKGKIGTIIFGVGTGIIAFLIILFQVLEYFKR
jgi:hypothetical protein